MNNLHYTFEWDISKELNNIRKHKVTFSEAIEVFSDSKVIHLEDSLHSEKEKRYYAVGKTKKGKLLTVRYTWRGRKIRIFGAAQWRKWRKFYEQNS